MQNLRDLLSKNKSQLEEKIVSSHKYISKEYQSSGYRLAVLLDDIDHVSMYIRICKQKPSAFIEQAISFISDYPNAQSKTRLFLWKIKQLTEEYNLKNGFVPEKKKSKSKRITEIQTEGSLFSGKRIKLAPKEKPVKKTAKVELKSKFRSGEDIIQPTLFS